MEGIQINMNLASPVTTNHDDFGFHPGGVAIWSWRLDAGGDPLRCRIASRGMGKAS
jgi:hypothetical protein